MVAAIRVSNNENRSAALEAEIQVITLGTDVTWVAIPREYFVELGMANYRASPFPITIKVEQANG